MNSSSSNIFLMNFSNWAKLVVLYSEHLYSHYLDSTIYILFSLTIFALSHIYPLSISVFIHQSLISFLLLLFYSIWGCFSYVCISK